LSAVKKLTDFLRAARRKLIRRTRQPAVGKVDLGSLDRVTPVSSNWGFDRGTPVDRLYIEQFIADRRDDIHGRVLEVADNTYTLRFGGDRVTQSDILSNDAEDKRATLVLDLAQVEDAPENQFDCIICTQTLHLIYDLAAAVQSLHKMLKPGGTLLLTGPTITAISRWDADRHGDHWRFTSAAVRRLFSDVFSGSEPAKGSDPDIRSYGNVYAATAFLHGLAVEELDDKKLSCFDPDYEMLIAIRVQKQPENQ